MKKYVSSIFWTALTEYNLHAFYKCFVFLGKVAFIMKVSKLGYQFTMEGFSLADIYGVNWTWGKKVTK